jgi:hypothetical protein
MLQRFGIQSRAGNFALAVIGAMYAVAAVVLLVYYGTSVGRLAARGDLLVQLLLVGGIACGVYFVSLARVNLSHHLHHQ